MAGRPTPPPADDPSYPHEAYLGDVPLPDVSYPPERPVGLHLRLHVADPAPGGPAGRVTDVAHRGWRRLDVGTAQAWLYPAEGTLVLWEAYLHDRHRTSADPAGDPGHGLLWDGFEGALLRVLTPWGPIRRLVTTWEDAYPRLAWTAFLDERGSLTTPSATFVKRLLPVAEPGAGGGVS